jgi:hypothetical protein
MAACCSAGPTRGGWVYRVIFGRGFTQSEPKMEKNGAEMRKNRAKNPDFFQKWWVFPQVFPQKRGVCRLKFGKMFELFSKNALTNG